MNIKKRHKAGNYTFIISSGWYNMAVMSVRILFIFLLLFVEAVQARSITPSCQADANAGKDLPHYPQSEIHIFADTSEADLKEGSIVYSGHVVVEKEGMRLSAEEISYDSKKKEVRAPKGISIEQQGIEAHVKDARIDIVKKLSHLKAIQYRLPTHGGRGKAKNAVLREGRTSTFNEVNYSTCPQGKNDWNLVASKVEIDHQRHLAIVTNANLKFKKVPIFWFPKFYFPISDQRMSGFLAPKIGYSSDTGLDILLPYYLNLAPNYDLTLYPRFTRNNGFIFGSEFRWLAEKHDGILYSEFIPDDRSRNESRYAVSLKANYRWNDHFRGHINYNELSDTDYLTDLNDLISINSSRFATQQLKLTYNDEKLQSYLLFKRLKLVDENSEQPYHQWPALGINWYHLNDKGFIRSVNIEYTNFVKSGAVEGRRLDIEPAIGFQWRKPFGWAKGLLSARSTDYRLKNNNGDNSITRHTKTLLFDAGLTFERPAKWFGISGYQTLEPRLFYLYTPYVDQSDIPIFDTKEINYNYTNLFRANRFVGGDRVGDANQLVLGLTSRFVKNGMQESLFRASLGQIYYFDDRQVQLPGDNKEVRTTGLLVGDLFAQLSPRWSTEASGSYDPETKSMKQSLYRLNYHDRPKDKFASLVYHENKDEETEYSDLSFRWPLGRNLSSVGRWQYSLNDDITLSGVLGLEYDSCCWRLRVVTQRQRDDSLNHYDTSLYIQLELKGLGGIGSGKMESFLSNKIYGYNGFEYY